MLSRGVIPHPLPDGEEAQPEDTDPGRTDRAGLKAGTEDRETEPTVSTHCTAGRKT